VKKSGSLRCNRWHSSAMQSHNIASTTPCSRRLNGSHQPTAVYISGLDQPPASLAAAAAPHRLVALQGQLAVGDVQAIRRGGEGVVR